MYHRIAVLLLLVVAGLAAPRGQIVSVAWADRAWYEDADLDDFGDPSTRTWTPDHPAHWVHNGDDCDDRSAAVNPRKHEICHSAFDDDCDGQVNEPGADDCSVWSMDEDGDGYGSDPLARCQCEADALRTTRVLGDCDDRAADIHPEVADTCEDGVDANCDGSDLCTLSFGDADSLVVAESVDQDLGISVAVGGRAVGDGTASFLVGASGTDDGRGRVYVVTGAFTGEVLASNFYAIDGESAMDGLGQGDAVGAPVDLDGDGWEDYLVGAPGADEGRSGSVGRVYLIPGPLTTSVSVASARLVIEGDDAYDSAAYAIDGRGDLDGDGVLDVMTLSHSSDTGGGNGGAVYGVSADGVGLVPVRDAPITIVGDAEDRFTAALYDDLDGDGAVDIAIGAPGASVAGPYTGAVYVYFGPVAGGHTPADADAVWWGPRDHAGVGVVVERGGDTDGDGRPEVLVAGSGWGQASGVWLVREPARSASLATAPWAVGSVLSSDFGASALGDLDLDGDGGVDLVLGRPPQAEGQASTVFVYRSPGTGRVTEADADVRLEGEGDTYTPTPELAAPGDVDGDGLDDLLIGDYTSPRGAAAAGAVYLLWGSQLPW